jgi:hypothetical protein
MTAFHTATRAASCLDSVETRRSRARDEGVGEALGDAGHGERGGRKLIKRGPPTGIRRNRNSGVCGRSARAMPTMCVM